jgi:ribosomal protein L12E/L44/L45/RPP1/RPP2
MTAQRNTEDASHLSARAILQIAAELEVAEERIKSAIETAAVRGDHARVLELIHRWKTLPVTEVLGPEVDLIDERPLR